MVEEPANENPELVPGSAGRGLEDVRQRVLLDCGVRHREITAEALGPGKQVWAERMWVRGSNFTEVEGKKNFEKDQSEGDKARQMPRAEKVLVTAKRLRRVRRFLVITSLMRTC